VPAYLPEEMIRAIPRIRWIAFGFLLAWTAGVMSAFTADAIPARSIRAVLAAPPSRGLSRLEGTVRSLATNQLALTDATGEIRLMTCPAWYRPLLFGARERVRVVGHVAPRQLWRANRPSFLVYRLEGEYGTRVTLRQNDGVPLWHHYRGLPGRQLQWEIARDLASAN
jgi:hypothetical protein